VLEGKVMFISWRPHQTTSRRKIITIQEWADYIGVSKNTILARLKKYRLLYEYDSHDIYSVLDFFKFLQSR
jgi:predicted transcriptional regulator